ncbi:hypothetical protein DAEQUDRAFT_531181 [Daedalea quercina L-15889]|uniref:Uncharacterized protein n=1 Tax=Daedalea quercina L-15889 TaxID=1314783 RepID=A0A165M8Q9_9APHY|nr:hypothetical protein DAEQUDRAFT_531181 [Daedalea quercina L-15889]
MSRAVRSSAKHFPKRASRVLSALIILLFTAVFNVSLDCNHGEDSTGASHRISTCRRTSVAPNCCPALVHRPMEHRSGLTIPCLCDLRFQHLKCELFHEPCIPCVRETSKRRCTTRAQVPRGSSLNASPSYTPTTYLHH